MHYITSLIDITQKKMDEEKCELQGSISMTKGLRYQGLLAFSKYGSYHVKRMPGKCTVIKFLTEGN